MSPGRSNARAVKRERHLAAASDDHIIRARRKPASRRQHRRQRRAERGMPGGIAVGEQFGRAQREHAPVRSPEQARGNEANVRRAVAQVQRAARQRRLSIVGRNLGQRKGQAHRRRRCATRVAPGLAAEGKSVATNVPRPGDVSIHPSASSSASAARTVLRCTSSDAARRAAARQPIAWAEPAALDVRRPAPGQSAGRAAARRCDRATASGSRLWRGISGRW